MHAVRKGGAMTPGTPRPEIRDSDSLVYCKSVSNPFFHLEPSFRTCTAQKKRYLHRTVGSEPKPDPELERVSLDLAPSPPVLSDETFSAVPPLDPTHSLPRDRFTRFAEMNGGANGRQWREVNRTELDPA